MKREDWNIEDFLKEVPMVPGHDITAERVLNYGVSCYLYYLMEQGEEDYQAYLKVLKESGFTICAQNTTGIKGYFYSTTFEKGDVVVTVRFWTKNNCRLDVCGCLTHYRNNRSAEEVFADVPVLDGEVEHRGNGTYVLTAKNVDFESYINYQKTLEKAGFEKYVDNGKGLGGTVFSSTYVRKHQVITVCYMARLDTVYISASIDLPLSEHLQYKDEYQLEHVGDAKTRLHMMELWNFGSSFILQLKNGHFIINDGGHEYNLPYLLDYLENLTPEGEKPVIEAWFITHMHRDHCGVINSIVDEPERFAHRMFIEGFYYSEPNDIIIGIDPASLSNIIYLKRAAEVCRTSNGDNPKVYRPQTGQRYYFCDVTMDIVLSQEYLEQNMYNPDINETSTCCMYTVDGQRCLFVGDAEQGCQEKMMAAYESEYFDLDLFTLPHHGFNTRDEFTDYSKVKTVLASVRDKTPKRRDKQNAYLKERVQEWLMWGDGTKVLTFPYKAGTYETRPNFRWEYHEGLTRPLQPNMD